MQNQKTIIPSVRELKLLQLACKSKASIILLSNTDIGNLIKQTSYVHKFRKKAFVHLELIAGFAPDAKGLRLLKNMYQVDGVFTTNIQAGNIAKSIGLNVIYRFFLIDSRSLKRTDAILENNKFDAIEVLPACSAIAESADLAKLNISSKLFAGGFIKTLNMVDQIFRLGFSGITTSNSKLWQ